MNLLLGTFSTFWNNFVNRISTPAVIVALIFAVVGLALAIMAKRVARAVRKSNEIDDKDAVYISFKAVGLVFLFVAVLIIVFRAGV
jgi:uncharacterized protein YacL